MAIEDSDVATGDDGAPARRRGSRALVPYAYVSDSIDVVDLFAGLWKGRWWFFAVFLLCFAAGVLVGVAESPEYSYNAIVQGGTIDALGGHKPFVTGEALAGRLQQVEIPRVLGEAIARGNPVAKHMSVDVSIVQGTDLVMMSALGGASSGTQIAGILNDIAHAVSLGINQKIRRYEDNERNYLNTQIPATQATIATLEKRAEELGRSGPQGASAATLVAVEISHLTDQVAGYRNQLEVKLPSNIQKAGLVAGVTRSAKPVSLGWPIWTGIGAVCGFVLGLLAAALARLVTGVRKRLRTAA